MGKQVKTDSVILIDANALNKMFRYAQYAQEHFDSEIAGWAHYNDDQGIYKLAPLTKQKASRTEVDNFPNDILEKPGYDISDMMVQWHSHVNMNVFWSGTDENCIRETLKLTKTLISVVVNIFGEYKCRVDSIVLGRAKHMVELNQQITQDCILQPYHQSAQCESDVLRCLKEEPKPAYQPPVIYNGFRKYDDYDDTFVGYTGAGVTSFNIDKGHYELLPYGSPIKKKWNSLLKRWEHEHKEKKEEDIQPNTNSSNDGQTYWQRERDRFLSENKESIVSIIDDDLTDTKIFCLDTDDSILIEWSKYGLSVNDIDYTVPELKRKFGLI